MRGLGSSYKVFFLSLSLSLSLSSFTLHPKGPSRYTMIGGDDVALDEDKLPQPYRTIDKLLRGVVESAWEAIEAKARLPCTQYAEGNVANVPATASSSASVPHPAASTLLDSDLYVGRADGTVERTSIMFSKTTLQTQPLHSSPITYIAASHISIPFVATSTGTEVKVVCFPLAPIRTARAGSITLSDTRSLGAEQRASHIITDVEQEEKERMLSILHLEGAALCPKLGSHPDSVFSVHRLHFSPCGSKLAVTYTALITEAEHSTPHCAVRVYDLGDTDYESGSTSTANTEPVLEKIVKARYFDVFFVQTKEYTEAVVSHEVVLVANGGYNVFIVSLREDADVSAFIEKVGAGKPSTPDPAVVPPTKERKPSKGKNAVPVSLKISARRPMLAAASIPEGKREFRFASEITAAGFSNTDLLSIGCKGGIVRVIHVASGTHVFSASVDTRRELRVPNKAFWETTAVCTYEGKYLAAAFSLSHNNNGEYVQVNSAVHVYDISLHDYSPATPTAPLPRDKHYNIGDHVEVFFPLYNAWRVGTIRTLPETKGIMHLDIILKDTVEVESEAAEGCATTMTRRNYVKISADSPHCRRLQHIGTIPHIPRVRSMHFCPLAPFLFYVPETNRVACYDVLSGAISAVIGVQPEGSRRRVFGVGAERGAEEGSLAARALLPFSDGLAVLSAEEGGGGGGDDGGGDVRVTVDAFSLPSVIKTVYPELAEALSSFAGMDHVYSLMGSLHYTYLRDAGVCRQGLLIFCDVEKKVSVFHENMVFFFISCSPVALFLRKVH